MGVVLSFGLLLFQFSNIWVKAFWRIFHLLCSIKKVYNAGERWQTLSKISKKFIFGICKAASKIWTAKDSQTTIKRLDSSERTKIADQIQLATVHSTTFMKRSKPFPAAMLSKSKWRGITDRKATNRVHSREANTNTPISMRQSYLFKVNLWSRKTSLWMTLRDFKNSSNLF